MASVFNSQEPDWPLFIGVMKEQEIAWTPKGRGNKWDGFRDNWNSIGDETTMKAVSIWAKRMRYDEESVEADEKDENLKGTFKPLKGIAAKELWKDFEQLVSALP
ncbi:hypothetical protein ACHAP5_012363, partial [Fusarium lateritium]